MSVRRTLLSLAGASALALTCALPASAQTLAVSDPRGDMTAFNETDESQTVDPAVENGDVVRTVFRHSGRRVGVRVKYADLAREGEGRADLLVLRTNEGVRRDVVVFSGPGVWRGEATMFRPNGREVSCPIRHRVDYADEVLALSFPRSCLSRPRWVRTGVGSLTFVGEMSYVDDAQRRGPVGESDLTMSPRVRRG